MPKTKISEFSATAGNNTDIDGINISEGCAPSGINDAIRELMAQLKDFQAGTAGDSFNGPIGATTPAAGTFTNLSASGTFALTGDQVQISEGGTGQTTANAAFNALAPSQATHAGKYLKTDGTNTSWDALDISTADITGTLPIANGGTGLTALGTGVQTALGQNVTGSGGIVLASSPSLTTPNLGTPSAVTLTNATGLPLSTGVTGTLATTNGGTGLTSFSANQVFYASSTSAVAQSANLQFSGTDLTVYGITVGRGAGAVSTNTAVGASALAANTGAYNTAVGYYALTTNTSGQLNVALGRIALELNTTGGNNTALGDGASQANTTGSNNVSVGRQALGSNTTASNNTAVGYQALYANTTATGNTAVGAYALDAATTGGSNTAVGIYALTSLTTGVTNSAFGEGSLISTTTGSYNTALGYQSLQSNTTASNNTAVGYQAGYSNTTAGVNVYVGYQAGYTNSLSQNNVFIGNAAGYTHNVAALGNGFNTAVGAAAGYSLTTGTLNTFIGAGPSGFGSGYYVTTGSKNTILGGYNGNQGGLDIRTASNYIVLSDGDGNPRGVFDASGNLMVGTTSTANAHILQTATSGVYNTQFVSSTSSSPFGLNIQYTGAAPNGTGNEFLVCNDTGATRLTVRSNGGIANYQANDVNLSDRREKTNFAPAKSYLDTICAIPVQTFNYIDQPEDDPGLTLGVVAQDVQAVAPELVSESNWAKEGEDPKMRLSIYQTDLQYALMKCIQELKAELDSVKAELATLKGA